MSPEHLANIEDLTANQMSDMEEVTRPHLMVHKAGLMEGVSCPDHKVAAKAELEELASSVKACTT